MRKILVLLLGIGLQGCAGTPSLLKPAQQTSLQALGLYRADGTAQYALYLACHSTDVSCITAENVFEAWASARQIPLRMVESDDSVFRTGQPRRPLGAKQPYRLALRVEPVITPSYDESGGTSGNMRAGFTPPRVGYVATLVVIESSSGKQLLTLSLHEQRTAAYKADAGSYIRAEMQSLIHAIDPSWRVPG